MPVDHWIAAGTNCAVASLLVVSGTAKLMSPWQLSDALGELSEYLRNLVTGPRLRAVAFTEALIGLLLIVPQGRSATSLLAGLLGVCFVAVGIAGWRRGGTTACGCFGTHKGRPFGPINIAAGMFVMSAPIMNWTHSAAHSAEYFSAAAMTATLGILLLCAWVHRSLILDLTKPLIATRQGN